MKPTAESLMIKDKKRAFRKAVKQDAENEIEN
jgi:hypothetical protein